MRRRQFLRYGAMSLASGVAAKSAWSAQGRGTVLVLGGTGFLGPATGPLSFRSQLQRNAVQSRAEQS